MIKRFLPILIILFSVILFFIFSLMKKRPEMKESNDSSVLAEFEEVIPKNTFVVLEGYGTVKPLSSYKLISQVKGDVTANYPGLKVGSEIKKGELIFAVDSREYEYIVEEKKAVLQKAILKIREEEGRQIVAKKEWDLVGDELKNSQLSKDLALRKYYLEENKANVNAARNSLKRAMLDVEKTKVYSPCDGIITSENLEIGQFLKVNSQVGEFVCTDVFQVIVFIAQSKLEFFQPIDKIADNVKAEIKNRKVKVVKLLPYIDNASKMLQVFLEIEKPLETNHPVMLEEFVQVSLNTKKIDNIYRVPNKSLQHNESVMLVEEDENKQLKLKMAKFEVVSRERKYTLIRFKDKISNNIKVITSYIAFPYDGMKITTKNSED